MPYEKVYVVRQVKRSFPKFQTIKQVNSSLFIKIFYHTVSTFHDTIHQLFFLLRKKKGRIKFVCIVSFRASFNPLLPHSRRQQKAPAINLHQFAGGAILSSFCFAFLFRTDPVTRIFRHNFDELSGKSADERLSAP